VNTSRQQEREHKQVETTVYGGTLTVEERTTIAKKTQDALDKKEYGILSIEYLLEGDGIR
jgi:hypothetical protein